MKYKNSMTYFVRKVKRIGTNELFSLSYHFKFKTCKVSQNLLNDYNNNSFYIFQKTEEH